MTRSIVHAPRTLTFLFCVGLSGSLYAAQSMPKVQFVTGDVALIHADGSKSPVRKGDVIAPGERLVTGTNGMAQIRAIDQGVLALRPNSECEFKPSSDGFDVSLSHGQLRAVTDVGGDKKGLINVLTPDSKIAVGNGDAETGVQMPDASGKGGESFSQAHLGVIKVDGLKGGALTLQPGQLATTAIGLAPTLTNLPPSFINPVVPVGDLSGLKTSPTATLGPVVNSSIATNSNLTVLTSNLTDKNINSGALGNLGAIGGKSIGTGVGSLATLDTTQTKLPEVKVSVSSFTIPGGSTAVNDALRLQPVLSIGPTGSSTKTFTPTNASGLIPNETVPVTTSNITLPNSQNITVFKPVGGGTFTTPTGVSNNAALVTTAVTTGNNNTISNTALNGLGGSNTVNLTTNVITTPIKIGVLPKF